MKTKPEMTEDEIRSYMDFDRLLEMHRKTRAPRNFLNTRSLLILGLAVGAGVFTGVMFFDQGDVAEQKQAVKTENANEQTSGKKDERPISDSTSSQLSSDILRKDGSKEPQNIKKLKPPTAKKGEQAVVKESASENTKDAKHESEKPVVNLVYVQAVPVNGYPDLYEYFNRELKYPQEAIKDSIRGEVIAVFTINTEGSPEKIVIENSLGPLFDKEVVRLVINMPPWKPATYNNKPVASKMSLPLTFQIKKIPLTK